MSHEEWKNIFDLAWETYYSPEHIETVMRRARASGISVGQIMFMLIWFYGCTVFEKVHPLDGGYIRLKYRRDRRPGLPIENPFLFYQRWLRDFLSSQWRFLKLVLNFARVRRQIKSDPEARAYTDLALTPAVDDGRIELELLTQIPTAGAAAGSHAG
jgi:hypothetical protein